MRFPTRADHIGLVSGMNELLLALIWRQPRDRLIRDQNILWGVDGSRPVVNAVRTAVLVHIPRFRPQKRDRVFALVRQVQQEAIALVANAPVQAGASEAALAGRWDRSQALRLTRLSQLRQDQLVVLHRAQPVGLNALGVRITARTKQRNGESSCSDSHGRFGYGSR